MPDSLCNIQARIAQSDEKALAALYQHLHKKLLHFARLLVTSHEIAEEIVEDVFVKLWCNRNTIHEIKNLSVYLYVAVKNKSLNVLSQKAAAIASAPFDHLEFAIEPVTADPHNLLITAEMMHTMQQAIQSLPPRCKIIFKLIREDGLSYKDTAEILNISVNTIDAQMAIAVKKICTALNIHRPVKATSFFSKKK